jgi:transcriptional regulator with XRE-family HTH domain
MRNENTESSVKKEILLNAIGKIVKSRRKKGLLRLAFEYDLPNTTLAKLEKGLCDPQISTLWKISNALGLKFSDFISLVEKELPQDFMFEKN